MIQDKFTEEEFHKLKYELSHISTHLPEHLTGMIWTSYGKIAGNVGGQPCTCASSGGLWAGAIKTIRDYIKSVEVNEE